MRLSMISSPFIPLKPIFWAKNARQVWESWLQESIKYPEIQVWQTRDRSGECFWSGYDPATGRSISQVSEERIRAWVEKCMLSS